MRLSRKDVEKIASLARLQLTDEEKALYQDQLSAILEYAERLNQLDLEGVPPTSSAVALENVLRADESEAGLPIDDVLFNAARIADNQFLIQPVLDED